MNPLMGGSFDRTVAEWIQVLFYLAAAGVAFYLVLRRVPVVKAPPAGKLLAFRCSKCGYILAATDSLQCPECGAVRDHLQAALELHAAAILEARKKHIEQSFGYRVARDSDFAWLDRAFYKDTAFDLAGSGYHFLGDLVAEQTATVQRIMVSDDRSTIVAMIELHPRRAAALPKSLSTRRIHIQTEFTDGRFLETTNSADLPLVTLPPELVGDRLPSDTAMDVLIKHHEQGKRAMLQDSGTKCVTISTIDDVIAAQERQRELERVFRRQIGYVDPEEYRSWAISDGKTPEFANSFANAIEKARRRHLSGRSETKTAGAADNTNPSA